jgi:hypothetical protein
VLASAGLGEESVGALVVGADGAISGQLTIGLDTMLCTGKDKEKRQNK